MTGYCECGERCSCTPDKRCELWHEGGKPTKIYGLLIMHKEQKPLIEKHCFGDCGKISMAGGITDDQVGALMVCCEEVCPWLKMQMDEPYGTTMSFGRPHEVYLRTLNDTPTNGVSTTDAAMSRSRAQGDAD